ncbi:helix-turn-helix domain-containing protein [Candidatus Pseudothioglobus singularis]|nr:helix-turn-helix domain-containing protein [Candidatus Pseudothioglobus singularis]
MNTKIVAYLIKTKGMTQTDIASKLKSADEDTFGVSQALVSKWNRGEKIPKDREIEMLKLADLFWELEYPNEAYHEGDEELPNILMDPLIDSKWNIIVQSEKNQEDWYDFFTDVLSPKKFNNEHSEYKYRDFIKFVRECIFVLNDAGFKVPKNPDSITKDTSSRFFAFFKFWMHKITLLQYWCSNSIPHRQKDSRFTELYNNLPRIALAQASLDDIDIPEQTDGFLLGNFIDEMDQVVKNTIDDYYQWEGFMMENFFGEDSFNEILIYSNDDINDNISQSSSTISSDETQQNDDKYLSFAERKILDRLKANEKLIQELNQKIDLLIDQNNESDGIPF